MIRTSVPGSDGGSLVPAVLLLSFLILCALCALAALADRQAGYARKLENSLRSDLEKQNGEAEQD
jgi:hypothetical protein